MMLVINCAGKILIDDVWEDRTCSYKIINCPDLSQAQQAALVERLSPLVASSTIHSNMPIISWNLENNDFVTPKEIATREELQDQTWVEPSCEYLDAIVWNGIGQKAFA